MLLSCYSWYSRISPNDNKNTLRIRKKKKNYIKSTPQVTAENILNRKFTSNHFGEKWLTDVTEMRYRARGKAYLSAILDLADKSIVSFSIGNSNNNELVFRNFKDAHSKYPKVKPIFHSNRGYQYTSKLFKYLLDKAGMTQSMSSVSRFIDNGPMEAFWGVIKSEMYNLRKLHTFEELISTTRQTGGLTMAISPCYRPASKGAGFHFLFKPLRPCLFCRPKWGVCITCYP